MSVFHRYLQGFVVYLLCMSGILSAVAQKDTLQPVNKRTVAEPVVITATLKETALSESPVPVAIMRNETMYSSGMTRMDEVLANVPGLSVVSTIGGSGLQLQGLDPAYTLILLDGQPLIGRVAGTFDLTRITTQAVERVEVIKGPLSSLYGSEALAGVVNIITARTSDSLRINADALFQGPSTYNGAFRVQSSIGDVGLSLALDYAQSDGFDHTPSSPSQTMSRYHQWTLYPKLTYQIAQPLRLTVSGRYYDQRQYNLAGLLVDTSVYYAADSGQLRDWNSQATFEYFPNADVKLELKGYVSGYKALSTLTENNISFYDTSIFEQVIQKYEFHYENNFNDFGYMMLGSGYVFDHAFADRISGGDRKSSSWFVFGQHEWKPLSNVNIYGSLRFDDHSEYASKLSPKLSFVYRPLTEIAIRGSVGTGFKAPTFQQLYLDFSNPLVGYSVFGVVNAKQKFQELKDRGEIAKEIGNYDLDKPLLPESALSFNGGIEYSLFSDTKVTATLFRNNVHDQIEAVPVAAKTNGQNVFTYVNINTIHTEGAEIGLSYAPFTFLKTNVGYQYLITGDDEVEDMIRNGKLFKTGRNGVIRPVQMSEYGGLFLRSKHSATLSVEYRNEALGFGTVVIGTYRSKYGNYDRNQNGILDDDSEYADGYTLLKLGLTKQIVGGIAIRAGVDNIVNFTDMENQPTLFGRVFYGGVSYTY